MKKTSTFTVVLHNSCQSINFQGCNRKMTFDLGDRNINYGHLNDRTYIKCTGKQLIGECGIFIQHYYCRLQYQLTITRTISVYAHLKSPSYKLSKNCIYVFMTALYASTTVKGTVEQKVVEKRRICCISDNFYHNFIRCISDQCRKNISTYNCTYTVVGQTYQLGMMTVSVSECKICQC